MSSREIAKLTGSTHDNVLKTIRGLIKKGVVSGNETPYIHPQNGQTYKEFHLDYRNTMVVTSGYSVELRAKIIDRWIELETKTTIQITDSGNLNATPKPKRPRKPPMLATFKTGYGIAKELGLDDNQAASHAGRYCLNKCGENPLPALGLDSRPTPTEANYYTVTELGKEIGLSGQAMNKLLIEQGYQAKVSGGSSSAAYEPTEKGKPHARIFDEVRKGGRGSQQALKWKHVIVSLLHPFTKTPA
ncbi:hypothetical protein FKW31_07925 [Acetobacter sp. DmW_136]|nr:hypothetical protein FKW31_07925 [Acetobacter sp. DmW_136]